MKANTFYFPHDFDAAADPKMQTLLSKHGANGYGVFWRIVELLHAEPTHKIPLKEYIFISLSNQLLIANKQIIEIIQYAISPAELLQSDGTYIWSNRVESNIQLRQDISIKRAISGSLGGKTRANASSKQANASSNVANPSKGKERKGKESYTSISSTSSGGYVCK